MKQSKASVDKPKAKPAGLALINKYRPSNWDEVVGHQEIMAALRRRIGSNTVPHAFLLTGPAGIGKTTTARLIGKELEAEPLEIDAATWSGVDDMREIVSVGSHVSLSGKGRRIFIIDECHTLSTKAWQALLKITEEPPAHLFFAFCTTELGKVPETIVSRCYPIALRPLSTPDLVDLLEAIAEAEGWEVRSDVMNAVVQAGTGQPRKAISLLESVHDAESMDEVARIITLSETGDPLIQLCRDLLSNKGWEDIKRSLAKVEDGEFENANTNACRYILGAMLKSDEKRARIAWSLLDALTFPTSTYDRKVAFCAAIGRILWSND